MKTKNEITPIDYSMGAKFEQLKADLDFAYDRSLRIDNKEISDKLKIFIDGLNVNNANTIGDELYGLEPRMKNSEIKVEEISEIEHMLKENETEGYLKKHIENGEKTYRSQKDTFNVLRIVEDISNDALIYFLDTTEYTNIETGDPERLIIGDKLTNFYENTIYQITNISYHDYKPCINLITIAGLTPVSVGEAALKCFYSPNIVSKNTNSSQKPTSNYEQILNGLDKINDISELEDEQILKLKEKFKEIETKLKEKAKPKTITISGEAHNIIKNHCNALNQSIGEYTEKIMLENVDDEKNEILSKCVNAMCVVVSRCTDLANVFGIDVKSIRCLNDVVYPSKLSEIKAMINHLEDIMFAGIWRDGVLNKELCTKNNYKTTNNLWGKILESLNKQVFGEVIHSDNNTHSCVVSDCCIDENIKTDKIGEVYIKEKAEVISITDKHLFVNGKREYLNTIYVNNINEFLEENSNKKIFLYDKKYDHEKERLCLLCYVCDKSATQTAVDQKFMNAKIAKLQQDLNDKKAKNNDKNAFPHIKYHDTIIDKKAVSFIEFLGTREDLR